MTAAEPRASLAVIPVIDIKHGLAVRAKAGERNSYRPIDTPLAASPDPVDVARGLLAAFPARRLYIADLDGIEGRERDLATVHRIADACPNIELWVDAGFHATAQTQAFLAERVGRPVLGSESQCSPDLVRELADGAVLSLDFGGDGFVGPPELLRDPTLWPSEVIVMTLARVGSGAGPDLARLSQIIARARGSHVFAAGGLRGPQDIAPLVRLGVAGVLVATALHDGRLLPEHLPI